MKYFVKIFVITLVAFVCTKSFAVDSKILFIDLTVVLNESKAGKKAQDFLKNSAEKNIKKFKEVEKSLKDKETDLIAKKDVISKEEYKKMADNLRKEVQNYQKERNQSLQKISVQRSTARSKLIEALRPLLEKYSKENNVYMILNKKDVLYADAAIDVTQDILKKLNETLPSINLK